MESESNFGLSVYSEMDNNGTSGAFKISSKSGTNTQSMIFDGNEIDVSRDGLYLNNNINEDILMVNGGGRVGIGVVSPSYKIQIGTNSAAKPTSNTWTVASDARLKKDITNYAEGLDEILNIHPVRFTYTGEAGMPQDTGIGVLAQELQKVAPYMVKNWTYKKDKEDAGQEYLAVDNGPMTYMLINAVKELNEEVLDLRSEIKIIKAELESLKTKRPRKL